MNNSKWKSGKLNNYSHTQLENQKKKYENEIEEIRELHKGLIEELKNSHWNERKVLEKRIISLEEQIREVIQNIALTEMSQNLRKSGDNLESIPDEKESEFESSYSRSQLLKSEDLQDSWKFNTSKVLAQNYELKEKLEELLDRIIPAKDTWAEDLKQILIDKDCHITDLQYQLEKAHTMLGNLRANVQDLKQRAKVLEDFLNEHTNKSWESYQEENNGEIISGYYNTHSKRNSCGQEKDCEEIM